MPNDLHTTAADRLGDDGQRYTTQRRALVDLLTEVDQPLTIPQLLERQPGLAQSSAYRNLAVLERAGVVHRIVTSDEFARYELAEDLTGHHHHLICIECGAVEDVPAPAGLERSVHNAAEEIARSTGFRTEHHRIDLLGRCKQCA